MTSTMMSPDKLSDASARAFKASGVAGGCAPVSKTLQRMGGEAGAGARLMLTREAAEHASPKSVIMPQTKSVSWETGDSNLAFRVLVTLCIEPCG